MKLIDDALQFEGGAQCSALYKWKAIYTSETLKLVGTKERIEKSFEIRKLVPSFLREFRRKIFSRKSKNSFFFFILGKIEKAIELDPKDGTPHVCKVCFPVETCCHSR